MTHLIAGWICAAILVGFYIWLIVWYLKPKKPKNIKKLKVLCPQIWWKE